MSTASHAVPARVVDLRFHPILKLAEQVADFQERVRATLLAVSPEIGHSSIMLGPGNELSPIPSAPFDDLDLDRPEHEEEWERRVMVLAAARIAAERIRLQHLGIIDAKGELMSRELPPDMVPESDATVETG